NLFPVFAKPFPCSCETFPCSSNPKSLYSGRERRSAIAFRHCPHCDGVAAAPRGRRVCAVPPGDVKIRDASRVLCYVCSPSERGPMTAAFRLSPAARVTAREFAAVLVTGANSRARTRTKFDAAGAKLSQKNHLQERQLLRTRGIAALAREFAPVTIGLVTR